MTKKIRHWRGRSKTTNSVIKTIHRDNFASAICPTNLEEQKEKFLEYGKTPEFVHRGTEDELEEIYQKPRSEIRFELLGEAIHILKTVKSKYGDAENYYQEMYGERVSKDEATDIIVDYLKENHLDGAMSVIWCTDLPCRFGISCKGQGGGGWGWGKWGWGGRGNLFTRSKTSFVSDRQSEPHQEKMYLPVMSGQ